MASGVFRGVLLGLVWAVVVCGSGEASESNGLPGPGEIERAILESLPAYWGIAGSSVTDPVDYGNPVEPEWRWRYEAVIAPKEPLFFEGGRVEEVILLQPSLDVESRETVYGVARATFHAGKWSMDVAHDNRPFEVRGRPASYFAGRVVILGSPEEQAELEAVRERNVKTLEARHEARMAAVRVEQRTALAEAEEKAKTEREAEEAKNEAMLALMKRQMDSAVAEIEQGVYRTVEAAVKEREAQMEALTIEMASAEERHKANLAAARAEWESELAVLNVEEEKKLAVAAEAHRAGLAASEAELKARGEEHRARIAESERLVEFAAREKEAIAAETAAVSALDEAVVALLRQETETVAKAGELMDARREALAGLLARLQAVGSGEEYQSMVATVAETGPDWLFAAVMRYGLDSEKQAMRVVAWTHLIGTDLEHLGSLGLRV